MDKNAWLYKEEEFNKPEEYFGFVYEIENLVTGKRYIGKKQFSSTTTRPPLKGKKRKRKVTKESNWRSYWGSSEFLKADLEEHGLDNFKRTILTLCSSKSSLTYNETKQLFVSNVLYERDEYGEKVFWNGNISGKFMHRKEIEEDLLR